MIEKKIFRIHYLIDKDFQLKYAVLLSLIAILISALIGGFFFFALKESYQILIQAGLQNHPQVQSLVLQWKSFLSYHLLILICGIIIFLTLFGILMTHKMVGPILVIKKRLQELSSGKYDCWMSLRKGDEFQELKDHFNHMLSSLHSEARKDIQLMESILPRISDPEVEKKIKTFIENLKKKLGEKP